MKDIRSVSLTKNITGMLGRVVVRRSQLIIIAGFPKKETHFVPNNQRLPTSTFKIGLAKQIKPSVQTKWKI